MDPISATTTRARTARLAVGLGAGVLLAAGPIAAPAHAAAAEDGADAADVCTSEKRPEVAAELSAKIQEVAQSREGDVSVGVSAFGGDLTCGYQPSKEYFAASSGKVLLLTTLLRQTMDEDRDLTAEEKELTEKMITVSDNDATIELKEMVGKQRMQDFLDMAGMDDTKLHETNAIGLMKINAADEITLLELISQENDILGDEQRAYAAGLMNSVIEEQRWGVTAGAPKDAESHVKNGWLPYDDTDVWRVNSIGYFTGAEVGTYHMVVLTDHNDGMQYGVDTIESVAVEVNAAINDGGTAITPRSTAPRDIDTAPDGSDRA